VNETSDQIVEDQTEAIKYFFIVLCSGWEVLSGSAVVC